ncbi:AraC family transcriptional regulator [Danxiaibacter flavus]|uniref:AraC family transcriptional regulator n=1 Tax=Danxiaibacter flavus TaxID=3049108 RepID=A0ABV3ZEL6_9BACT|nr:AraC family transcriptional regulator [Chitinophagaceae bacterium DXS]
MDALTEYKQVSGILYSCYTAFSREGEQFIPEHVFGHLISGSMIIQLQNRTFTFKEGDFAFFRRNHLAKFTKVPPSNGGTFKLLSVIFDQDTLRKFSMDYNYTTDRHEPTEDAIMHIAPDALLQSYVTSILPYLDEPLPAELVSLKVNEALFLLLKKFPALKNTLFDFNDPGKIDLQEFMNKNFKFNVELKRLAYLTGRSLATFKRDFEKIFSTSPSRWLLQKRLQEAYYLIKEQGKKPSDVYLEVGFESIAHFSYSFKKMFGVNPSGVRQ